MAQAERITILNFGKILKTKPYLAYWCFKALRTNSNHALEYAIHLANKHTLPLVVFSTTDISPPQLSARHTLFEIQALNDLTTSLAKRDIFCLNLICYPPAGAALFAREAAALVVDSVHLKEDLQYYNQLRRWVSCPLLQIESNLVVPVEVTSSKQETAAYTIRSKITNNIEKFLVTISQQSVETPSLKFTHPILILPQSYKPPRHKMVDNDKSEYRVESLNVNAYKNLQFFQTSFSIDNSISPIPTIGGEIQAKTSLQDFLEHRFLEYDTQRNNPSVMNADGMQSKMSPYLHYGNISPIDILLEAQKYIQNFVAINPNSIDMHNKLQTSYNTLFEELIIRRELSFNFVHYNNNYMKYNSIPTWAFATLNAHLDDYRPVMFNESQLESASTEDIYWNAAQNQLVTMGYIHGYMRMYWGKKPLEWFADPEEAYSFTLQQNNKYAIDGKDPNGYVGVSWCYGTHDRPFVNRPIFGTVRYMNANSLRSKFNMDPYLKRWN